MATLTYTGGTVNSNIVTGELREVLTAAKTAVREKERANLRANASSRKISRTSKTTVSGDNRFTPMSFRTQRGFPTI